MIHKLDRWHKTKSGRLFFTVIEFAIAYAFISLAINKGSLWYYLLTLIFLVGALQNFFKFLGSFRRGKR